MNRPTLQKDAVSATIEKSMFKKGKWGKSIQEKKLSAGTQLDRISNSQTSKSMKFLEDTIHPLFSLLLEFKMKHKSVYQLKHISLKKRQLQKE